MREFIVGKTLEDYERDAMLRAAVERQFEIIGEATAQLARADKRTVDCINYHQRIIAFRNVLIGGYANVDDRLVWSVKTTWGADSQSAAERIHTGLTQYPPRRGRPPARGFGTGVGPCAFSHARPRSHRGALPPNQSLLEGRWPCVGSGSRWVAQAPSGIDRRTEASVSDRGVYPATSWPAGQVTIGDGSMPEQSANRI